MSERLFPHNVVDIKPWQVHSPPSVHHSQESIDASITILPKRETLQRTVFEAIRISAHGLTDQEIVEVTGLKENTARPRRVELCEAGLITNAGTRPTTSGRQANVWIVKRGGAT